MQQRAIVAILASALILGGCTGLTGTITPQPRDDAIVATKIKAVLIEEATLDAAAIHVESDAGMVTLSGFAGSEEQRELAITLARSVDGVKQVNNQIEVK